MLLKEFFGKSIDVNKEMAKNRDDKNVGNDLFWYIIDHDRLHKDFFHNLAPKIHKDHKSGKLNKEAITKEFMPMVKKGCLEYFTKEKMKGRFEDNFDKEMMQEMCERLFDHYREDVIQGNYKIGV